MKPEDYPYIVNIIDRGSYYARDGKFLPRVWLNNRGYTVVNSYIVTFLRPHQSPGNVIRFMFKENTVATEFALSFL